MDADVLTSPSCTWPVCRLEVVAGALSHHYSAGDELPRGHRNHAHYSLTEGRTALVTTCPFRASHNTISDAGLIGDGQVLVPAEVSQAHKGILCPDELPVFRRRLLKVLRRPLSTALGGQRANPTFGGWIPTDKLFVEIGAADLRFYFPQPGAIDSSI